MERWEDIPEFEGCYQISNYGNVKRLSRLVHRKGLHSTQIKEISSIKFSINRNGYCYYRLNVNNKKTMIFPQRLVAKLFVPNPENKPEVNHIDGNKLNNNYSNLEWMTRKENMAHAFKNKLHDLNGEKSYRAKLKNEDVVHIRELFSSKTKNQSELGRQYGMSAQGIRDVILRKTWKHI